MIEQITASALAPFLDPTGWQGFAYGLLGLKTIRRVYRQVKEMSRSKSE